MSNNNNGCLLAGKTSTLKMHHWLHCNKSRNLIPSLGMYRMNTEHMVFGLHILANLCYDLVIIEVKAMKRLPFSLLTALVQIFFVIFPVLATSQVHAAPLVTPNYIISQGQPAYSNPGCSAAGGNDNNYSSYWSACNTPSVSNPQFLAYDLSNVPVSERGQVIVAWYNAANYNYDTAFFNDPAYNLAQNYTIDGNAAPGGSLPSSGWTSLATTTGNTYHSRQYSVNLSGYNWIRINVTASLGSSQNFGLRFNSFDIYNAAAGISDDWIFYGDSITANIMDPSGTPTWAQEINQADPSYFPLEESGGIGGLKSTDGAASIQKWLAIYPGHFVALNYGTNDAGGSPQTFYNAYVTMINAVINAGKVPVIPTIPWGCTANLSANVPTLNQEIQQLYTTFPQVIKGPDLYGYFSQPQNQADMSSNDCIHPDGAGDTAYKQLWTNAMLSEVYQNGLTPPTAALSVTPNSGTAPLAVTANASASTAGTNPIASYSFNFGDGSAVVGPQSGATASHTYTNAGSYTVTTVVTDSANLSSSQTSTVAVTNPSGGGGGTPQTPTFVQSNATTSSKTVSFTKSVAAGDLLVAGITTNDGGTDPISGVSDNLNGAWTKLSSVKYGNGHVELYYLANSAAGNITVTVGGSGALTIAEYSGVATSSPLDQYTTKASSGGTITAGPTATIAATNELVVGVGGQTYVGSGFTAGTGFTLRKTAVSNWSFANGLEDMLTTTATGQSMTMSSGGSGYYGAIVAVFK